MRNKRKITFDRVLAYVGMAGVFGYAFGMFGDSNTASLIGMGVGLVMMRGAEYFSNH